MEENLLRKQNVQSRNIQTGNMAFEFGVGIGFCIGFVFGINLVQMLYPEENESVWQKHIREKRMVNEAVEIERKKQAESLEDKEPAQR